MLDQADNSLGHKFWTSVPLLVTTLPLPLPPLTQPLFSSYRLLVEEIFLIISPSGDLFKKKMPFSICQPVSLPICFCQF